MEAIRSRPETTVAVATLVLAGSGAIVLTIGDAVGFLSARAEALFIVAQILGWTLVAWAMILGGLGGMQLVRRLVVRQGPAWRDVLLLFAGAAVIVAVIWTHRLWGSGSGTG
jgi:hypothetical protein